MTAEQVLNYIRTNSKPGDWVLSEFGTGAIRNVNNMCPICWIARREGKNPEGFTYQALITADRLGLPAGVGGDIVYAADNCSFEHVRPGLRQELLSACHLSEAAPCTHSP